MGNKLNINNNSKMYLSCGALLAVVAGFGAFTILDKAENLVPVVVATQSINPRTQITDSMVKVENVPALARNENAIDNTDLVVGGYATTKVFAGQTVIQPMVAKQFDESGSSGLALSIPDPSLRAVSFQTNPDNAVGGNIKKGDTVSIIVTIQGSKINGNTDITKTIYQNVEVFDTIGTKDSITGITLLLTLDQIETVKHAYAIGNVTYALEPGQTNGSSSSTKTRGMINKTFCELYNFNCAPKK